MMFDLPNNDWDNFVTAEFEKDYFQSLEKDLISAYQKSSIFPPKELVLRAFALCSLNNLSVVIVGQDPYPQPGYAEGLSFSVKNGIRPPASLKNILIESENHPSQVSPSLVPWAEQGVLLLNRTLTVQKGAPNSHSKLGWQNFTLNCIDYVNERKENVVFMLWGAAAITLEKWIDHEKHLVLKSGHPSPLSANRGLWFGNGHFDKANNYLKVNHKKVINWSLPSNTFNREPTLF
jgi:uracil-DNA glycosylase